VCHKALRRPCSKPRRRRCRRRVPVGPHSDRPPRWRWATLIRSNLRAPKRFQPYSPSDFQPLSAPVQLDPPSLSGLCWLGRTAWGDPVRPGEVLGVANRAPVPPVPPVPRFARGRRPRARKTRTGFFGGGCPSLPMRSSPKQNLRTGPTGRHSPSAPNHPGFVNGAATRPSRTRVDTSVLANGVTAQFFSRSHSLSRFSSSSPISPAAPLFPVAKWPPFLPAFYPPVSPGYTTSWGLFAPRGEMGFPFPGVF